MRRCLRMLLLPILLLPAVSIAAMADEPPNQVAAPRTIPA